MKDLTIGLLLGFCFGVACYYLVDGAANQAARRSANSQQREIQAQVNTLQQMCPEVLKRAAQPEEAKKQGR